MNNLMQTRLSNSTTPMPIIDDKGQLTAVANALLNDKELTELHIKIEEIYAKNFPIIVQVSPTHFRASYSDEVKEVIANIQKLIDFRKEQILSSYNL